MSTDGAQGRGERLSWLIMLGIWLLFVCLFSPLMASGTAVGIFIAVAGSIGCAWLLIAWINRQRRAGKI